MTKQPIITFPLLLSKGIEKIPNETFIYIECQQKFYLKVSNTGLDNTKTIQDAIASGAIILAGTRTCLPEILVSSSHIFWEQLDIHFINAQNYYYTFQPVTHLADNMCDTTTRNNSLEVSARVYFNVHADGSVTVSNYVRNQTDGIMGLPTIVNPSEKCLKYVGFKALLATYPYFAVVRKNVYDGEWFIAAPMYYSNSSSTTLKITRYPGGDGSNIPELMNITLYKTLPSGATSSGNANPLDILCVAADQSKITTEAMPVEVSYFIA